MRIHALRPSRYRIFICGCAILALAPVVPSFASGPIGPDVTVHYQDLDLNTAGGAATLLQRIKAAAASVCDPIYHGTLSSMVKRDQCQSQLTAEAVAKVNRPTLAAAYASSRRKSGSMAG